MNLSRILALAGFAVAAYMGSGWSGEAERVTAAAIALDVQQKELAAAKRDLATAAEINEANLAAILEVKAEAERQAAIAIKAKAAEAKRSADLKTALKRIKNAPKSEDGPIAPVLRRELDDLRTDGVRPDGGGTPAANTAHEDPGGATGPEAGNPSMQPPAPTS